MTDQIGKVKTTGTRKWEEHKSGSPETVEKPAKLVKSIDNQAMAASPSGQTNKMQRNGLLLSCWSLDGKIFVKTSPEGAPTRIFSDDDLKQL